MSENSMLVPLDRLPKSYIERHGVLRDYFCDKDAKAVNTNEGWELWLEWSDDRERYVDPRLQEGLDWWQLETGFSDMPLAKRRNGRVLQTLYDTWTLLSWSEWLARQSQMRASSVVLLHVDDHRDIGSPRLFNEPCGWRDPITKKTVSLMDPDSIHSAICSGAIGMGSFLTPFLHAVPMAEVRHLCQPPKSQQTLDFKILLSEETDTLLDITATRPSIELVDSDEIKQPGCYRLTPHLSDWLEGIKDQPILLHIDMDYFCNRYDGDSDFLDRPSHLNLSLDVVFEKIDELLEALHKNNICERLEDIVIAFSPSFFPAEYWDVTSNRLLAGLKR